MIWRLIFAIVGEGEGVIRGGGVAENTGRGVCVGGLVLEGVIDGMGVGYESNVLELEYR